MNGNGMPRADFVTSLALIAFGVAMLWVSLEMPRFEQRNINPYSIPGIVPGILAIVNLILAAILFLRSLRRGGYRLGGTARGGLFDDGAKRLAVAFVITVAYAVGLVGVIPFWLATFLFVAAFIIVFEWPLVAAKRRWIMIASALAQGAAVSAIVAMVFQELFLVTLP